MADNNELQKIYDLILELQGENGNLKKRLATAEERQSKLMDPEELKQFREEIIEFRKQSEADRKELRDALEFVEELIGLFVDILTTEWGRHIRALAKVRNKLTGKESEEGGEQ